MEIEGVKVPGRGVVVVKDDHCTHPLIVGMNVVTACWNVLKWPEKTAPVPQQLANQQAWRSAFATCRRIEASTVEDRMVGYVRLAGRCKIKVPPRSEIMVWGRAQTGPQGTDYCALVEALPETPDVGVARTLIMVKAGRVPVRICNPHPYPLFIGRYQKLGKLSCVDEADVHGSQDLSLSLGTDGVVEVALVDSGAPTEEEGLPEEMSKLIERPDLSELQQGELRALLLKWEKVFSKDDEDFGRTDLVHHCIPTGDAAPIRERYRPLPPAMYKEMRSLLADMMEKGVIRESCSPWAAPIVLVRKKDGTWRFCVDYRKLNAVTHKDAFPLPRIEETLTSLTRAQWFSTLDLASGYWQVQTDPTDREKTAFTTPVGLFEFERMPFGLCNAPATFQRLMQHCLSGQIAESLLVYLDDIIIYSPDFSSHLQHLDEVFQRLWRHGLKLQPNKCKFLQQEVKFLGHVVDKCGVRPDPDKISAVMDWPVPDTIRQVRSFLGLAGYYRRFVSGFAKIARPLTALLTGVPVNKKTDRRKVQWSPECQTAFEALKAALMQAPVLAYADYSLPFIVYTDASGRGLGAVLAQVQEGQERVIAYASRSLHHTERNDANYSSFKLELLALKWAVTEKFKDYLTGARFIVYTDNNPVAHLQTARLGAAEQRWVAQLASFDYEIKYRSGKSNINADALSRFPTVPAEHLEGAGSERGVTSAAIELTCEVEGSDWAEAQAGDPDIQVVKQLVEAQVAPTKLERQTLSHGVRRLLQQQKRLFIKDGILCRKVTPLRPWV
uniref:ribonuclease H n=1 Tax=Oreochromis niloticus TaxID=8128 RepID=A0A669D8G6_ORENI